MKPDLHRSFRRRRPRLFEHLEARLLLATYYYNAAPDVYPGSTSAVEGQSVSIVSSMSVPHTSWGNRADRVAGSYGDGSGFNFGVNQTGGTVTTSHTYVDQGSYPFAIQGHSPGFSYRRSYSCGWNTCYDYYVGNPAWGPTRTATVSVSNAPPTYSSSTLGDSFLEDAPIPFSVSATDPGNDKILAQFDWDGNTSTVEYTSGYSVTTRGSRSFGVTLPGFAISGTYNVSIRVADEDGGFDSWRSMKSITIIPVNDAPTFVAGADPSVLEDAGPQTVSQWATGITPGPSDESNQQLEFLVTAENPSLFSAQPAISVDGTLTYTPAPDISGSTTVDVILKDDGGTENGGVDQVSRSFTISIGSVNDPPTFVMGRNPQVLEDSGAHTIENWATSISPGPPDESGQQVVFEVAADNPALFAVQPAISSTGTLTFRPADDAFGDATVRVTLRDDGGTSNGGRDASETAAFLVSMTPVNDVPGFVVGASPVVLEDAGPQSVAGWATSIFVGPANEADQSWEFLVTADRPELFAAVPAVSPDGTLSFTPAANAVGATDVTIRLKDSGGVENGGSDTSAPQTVSIELIPVNDAPTFSAGAEPQVAEDAGPITIGGWASNIVLGPANESAQRGSFEVTADDPGQFSSQPAISPDGTLRFQTAADVNGAANVSVVLVDDGGTDNGGIDRSQVHVLVIQITPVNDPPTFTPGADPSLTEDAGPQSVAWASQISPGPADEAAQKVSFHVTTNQPGLFAEAPRIAGDGTLSFTPADDANGVAIVEVHLSDDGGGDDTSPPHQFSITIHAVNDPPTIDLLSQLSATEDTAVTLSGLVLDDIDAGDAHVQLTLEVDSGSLTMNVIAGGIPAGRSTGNGGTSLSMVGTLVELRTTLDHASGVVFQDLADRFGANRLKATINDRGNQGTGEAFEAAVAQSFTVIPVNDAPSTVTLANSPFPENSYGAPIGSVLVLDVDDTQHTYTVSDDRFEVAQQTLKLKNDRAINYEQESQIILDITARDAGGLTRTDRFTLMTVDVNDPPDVDKPIADAAATSYVPFSLKVDADTFSDEDGDTLGVQAMMADGSALPAWLTFDPVSMTFQGTAHLGQTGNLPLKVVASDGQATGEALFSLNVEAHGRPWQNPLNRLDTNYDGFVSPVDVLVGINYLNANSGKPQLPPLPNMPAPFYDTSGDDLITPKDVLIVINYLNARGGGEGEAAALPLGAVAPTAWATGDSRATSVGGAPAPPQGDGLWELDPVPAGFEVDPLDDSIGIVAGDRRDGSSDDPFWRRLFEGDEELELA